MKKYWYSLICSILGHDKCLKDWYPLDPITKICCLRCNKLLEKYKNPIYNEASNSNTNIST
jgi:hypothetical protein